MQGSPVRLHLQVGRWRCGNDGCPRKIFTERVTKLAGPWARRTNRLREVVRLIGHGMGGRPGERLLSCLGMPVSDDTILRAIKRVDVDTGADPLRVVGVDDWAWKKGQTCGTILVDLERRGVVEILPERSAESLAAWLAQHPEIYCSAYRGLLDVSGQPANPQDRESNRKGREPGAPPNVTGSESRLARPMRLGHAAGIHLESVQPSTAGKMMDSDGDDTEWFVGRRTIPGGGQRTRF